MSEAQSVKNLASERERERDKKNCVNSNNQHSNKHGEKFDEGKEEKRKKISNSYYLHMNASMETEDVLLLHTIYTHNDPTTTTTNYEDRRIQDTKKHIAETFEVLSLIAKKKEFG